jgi:hypothetical protein
MPVDEAFAAAGTTYSSNPFPVAARGGSFDALAPPPPAFNSTRYVSEQPARYYRYNFQFFPSCCRESSSVTINWQFFVLSILSQLLLYATVEGKVLRTLHAFNSFPVAAQRFIAENRKVESEPDLSILSQLLREG